MWSRVEIRDDVNISAVRLTVMVIFSVDAFTIPYHSHRVYLAPYLQCHKALFDSPINHIQSQRSVFKYTGTTIHSVLRQRPNPNPIRG